MEAQRLPSFPLTACYTYDPLLQSTGQQNGMSINIPDNDFDHMDNIDLVDYVLNDHEQYDREAYTSCVSQMPTNSWERTEWQHIQGTEDINEYLVMMESMGLENKCNSLVKDTLQNESTFGGDLTEAQSVELQKLQIIQDTQRLQSTIDNAKEEETSVSSNDTKREEVDVAVTPLALPQNTPKRKKRVAGARAKITKHRQTKRANTTSANTSAMAQASQQAQEDCMDVEIISDKLPVLEAGDVTSLLEQFEAVEASVLSNSRNKLTTNNISTTCAKSTNSKQDKQSKCHKKSKKSTLLASTSHDALQDSFPKEDMADRIKTQGRRKATTSSVKPATPKVETENKNNTRDTRVKSAGSTAILNKSSKVTNIQSQVVGRYVQLDHSYYNKNMSISTSNSNSKHYIDNPEIIEELFQPRKKVQKTRTTISIALTKRTSSSLLKSNRKNTTDRREYSCNNSEKKDNLLSADVNKTIKTAVPILSNNQKIELPSCPTVNNSSIEMDSIDRQETSKPTPASNNSPSASSTNISNDSAKKAFAIDKVRSVLARNILKMRRNQTLVQASRKKQQMVSVLKKPLITSQSAIKINNLKSNIVTTTSSNNSQIENIIVQAPDLPPQEEVKEPVRKKLNLAEYRNRRGQNQQGDKIGTPIQRWDIMDIYHACTTTEPTLDDFSQPIWCTHEIDTVIKPKETFEEEKRRPKSYCDVGIQAEVGLESSSRQLAPEDDDVQEIKYESNSSSFPSTSTSENRGKKRSRSTSRRDSRDRSSDSRKKKRLSRSRSRSQSRSRRRSRTRGRLQRSRSRSSSISVSSSTNSSRVSRLRRSRSRSKSRSSSRHRYSFSSRSSPNSNYGRKRWSRRSGSRERSRDRYERRDWHHDRSRRRSPMQHYRQNYDNQYQRDLREQIKERKVMYVGCIEDGCTRASLRERFRCFGSILDVSVHFRNHGDNYGFITFRNKSDTYTAIEHGNDDPALPTYKLCFGGRRAFCQSNYADLDGDLASRSPNRLLLLDDEDDSFDALLKKEKKRRHLT